MWDIQEEMGIAKLEWATGLIIEGKMTMMNNNGALLRYYIQVLNS
jgi:hypothetical protein